jgi:hypothetical protein
MNVIKQTIAIAEYCGYRNITYSTWPSGMDSDALVWGDAPGVKAVWQDVPTELQSAILHEVGSTRIEVPYYPNNLNAMHEAENTLKDTIAWHSYWQMLVLVCEPSKEYWRATAAQRAEAFLRTIGKWEE